MQRNPKFSLANDSNTQITGTADLVVRNTRGERVLRETIIPVLTNTCLRKPGNPIYGWIYFGTSGTKQKTTLVAWCMYFWKDEAPCHLGGA